MNSCKKLVAPACAAALGLAALAGTFALAADAKKDAKPAAVAAAPEGASQLPPGWTEADMKACMAAATPGKMHEHLKKDVGVWKGKSSLWMVPDSEPVVTDCTSTVTSMLDGRFIKTEHAGEMPGMGPYNGFGITGFDNVTQKFSSIWIDNHGTGMMKGEGELSPDGKTTTITYTFTCPVTNKPAKWRQIEKWTGPDSKVMEMFGPEPKSGKEYKIMAIELTRKPGAAAAAAR